jgi:16S rRNA (uracil1498-N3)-methyltransferase
MNIFLIHQTDNEIIHLSEDESYHCIKVLRMRRGDVVEMVDGHGGFYTGIIEEADLKSCAVKIQDKETDYGKRNYYLHVAIAPPKNIDRFEWFLEKATEIGIDEITPVICHRSERRDVKTERLNKVIVAAMKQSIKAWMPKLNIPKAFPDFVTLHSSSQKFICSCDSPQDSYLKNFCKKSNDVLLLIGPEGDFTAEEILTAEKYNHLQVSLGDYRLRTETAGIVACQTVSLLNS